MSRVRIFGTLAAVISIAMLSLLVLATPVVNAINPQNVSFQGKVVKADGTNVADGSYSFVFKLYAVSSAGSPLWTETQASVNVTAGTFQVNLGSSCSFFVASACNNNTPIDFNASNSLFLGITFNGDVAGEMTPRVQLQSVPYAFNADKVGGLAVGQLVQLSPGAQQTGNINVSGSGTFATSLQSAKLIVGTELSMVPVSGGQSAVTAYGGLQLVGNKQSSVDYTPATVGTNGAYGVIIPVQQAGSVGLMLRAAAAQTGDLLQVQDNSGAILAKIDSTGGLTTATTITAVGGISTSASVTASTSIISPKLVTSGALTINSGAASNITIDSSAAGTATVAIGGGNATAVALSRAGQTTTVNGSLTVAQAANLNSDLAVNGNITTSNLGIKFTNSDINPTCGAGDYKIYADTSEAHLKKCVDGVVSNIQADEIRSFVDTTSNAVVKNNTSSYWTTSAENNNSFPNITPSASGKQIFGIATMETQATTTNDVEVTARVEVSGTSGAACSTGTAVGGRPGTFASNTGAIKSSTTSFIYSPGSIAKQYFNVCADASTVGLAANVIRLRVSLWEVDNSNADLAEVYPTNDRTLSAGQLVSIDSSITNGVKRSSGAYDAQLLGVVSTSPALVIGGTGGQGTNGVPVALSGRVPVKVSTENGPIKTGDSLTASSTPGIAMKATKAGVVLGVAMQDFNPSAGDTVMTFIKSGNFNGTSVLDTVKASGDPVNASDTGQATLQYLLKQQADPKAALNSSQITTDRVTAGLEIVTPRLVTNELSVSGKASFAQDLTVSGTITADKIKANQIEGIEVITSKLTQLQQQVAAGVSAPTVPPTSKDINARSIHITDSNGHDVFSVDTAIGGSSSLNLTTANIAGGLSVGGDASFAGLTSFQKLATFIGKAVFHQDVSFQGHVALSADSAGYVAFKKDETTVHVTFTKDYDVAPIITLTNNTGAFTSATVNNVTVKGFDVVLQRPAVGEMTLSWIALGAISPVISKN